MRARFINNYAKDLMKKVSASLTDNFEKNKALIRGIEPSFTKRQINELAGYVTKMTKKKAFAE